MHDVREATDDNFYQVSKRYAWNHEFKTEFLDSLKSAATTKKLNKLNVCIPNCTENGDINQRLTYFNAITERAVSPLYKETYKPPNIPKQPVEPSGVPGHRTTKTKNSPGQYWFSQGTRPQKLNIPKQTCVNKREAPWLTKDALKRNIILCVCLILTVTSTELVWSKQVWNTRLYLEKADSNVTAKKTSRFVSARYKNADCTGIF